MALRPENADGSPNYMEWASETRQEAIRTEDGRVFILDNKKAPLPEFTPFGLRYYQPLNNQELNYQFDGISKFLKHLDERYVVGSIHMTTTTQTGAETPLQLQQRLGGTWVSRGGQALNGVIVEYWEKTS